jgi:DNA-directed RNA polymerase subunit M/transcription elongation factor TFIIS
MLPKLDVPIYDLTLPLLKKKIQIRPFLVKEEKIFLMAMESDDEDSVFTAIKQIVNNCCLTEDVDIESIPISDLEFIFFNLRARSIGEMIELKYKCNNKIHVGEEEKVCGNLVDINMNILDIKPEIPENHTNKIELSDTMGVVMKYPNFKLAEKIKNLTDAEIMMETVLNCIDYIYNADEIFYAKDVSKKELTEFVENMNHKQFEKLQKFFETIPKLSKEIDFNCEKCGHKEKILLEGIQNFFD